MIPYSGTSRPPYFEIDSRGEVAFVETAAEPLPAGEPLVHQRSEARTMVRHLEMRELVDHDVLQKLVRRAGEIGVVEDVPAADVA